MKKEFIYLLFRLLQQLDKNWGPLAYDVRTYFSLCKPQEDAFRKFPEKGITNPDDLPPNDSDVISANALLQVWSNQCQLEVRRMGTPEANLEFTLERSTIYVDNESVVCSFP